jgi:hypothetical protein
MNLGFVAPDLRQIDHLRVGALVLFLHEDEIPLPDVRGLVDWRLCGTLSRLVALGRLRGTDGETTLMPVGHRLGCDRLLVLGLGPRRALAPDELGERIRRALRTLAEIQVHSAAIALPGRPGGLTDPVAALEALLAVAPEVPELDEIVVIDDPPAQKTMNATLDLQRRRG